MKIRHRVLLLATIVPATLGGGCYTALKGPATASQFYSEPRYTQSTDFTDDLLAPSVGRFGDPYNNPYGGYSGAAPYGGAYGSYGTPVFGYDSHSRLFGNYGYGGYYPGAGPAGYGYDPYYSGAYGTYVPPGYELVTSRELDQLRTDAILNTTTPTTIEPPNSVLFRQQREEEVRIERHVWRQRQESRQGSTPAQVRRRPPTAEKIGVAPEASSSTDTTSKERKRTRPKKSSGR